MNNKIHITELQLLLADKTGVRSVVNSFIEVGGGSINETFRLQYGDKNYFLKVNHAADFPEMFKKEARGLCELSKIHTWKIPEVILTACFHNKQYLLMEYVESTSENQEYFHCLGKSLAHLHLIKGEDFGYEEDNFIGSLVQINKKASTWEQFFYAQRLEPFIKWGYDSKIIEKVLLKKFESLRLKLKEIFPSEKPSLLHGDLWSGNKMNSTYGPCVFDPTVYYGHREMDLAMTNLFGGFTSEFYNAYQETYPTEPGLEKRIKICNLYPLMVHVKLFGVSYLQDVKLTLKPF